MNRFFSTLLLCVATVLCVAGANPSAGGLPCLWHFDKARHAAHVLSVPFLHKTVTIFKKHILM